LPYHHISYCSVEKKIYCQMRAPFLDLGLQILQTILSSAFPLRTPDKNLPDRMTKIV
jgi:hypothetical protein